MNINIYGSTGRIGILSLKILDKNFQNIKINLLTANNNYIKLIEQSKIYKPKYIYLANEKKIKYLKNKIDKKIKILNYKDLLKYLSSSHSDLSLLAISGYNSLNYLKEILQNTNNLGLVNKECVVSAGHLFKKMKSKYKVNIFPLDSEHFSISHNMKKFNHKNIRKVYITASGGPFFERNIKTFNKISLSEATSHPKWKMGYKNSIDSATLANKCLEIIEAKYLFDIPFNKIGVVIHPESLVHSIIENINFTSVYNYFYHDMFIPIFNFFNFFSPSNKKENINKNFLIDFKNDMNLNFHEVSLNRYPIYKIFQNLDKSHTSNLIKFNCANEYAVDLFKSGVIKFNEISESIQFFLSLEFNYPVNSINSIIEFQKKYVKKIRSINLDL